MMLITLDISQTSIMKHYEVFIMPREYCIVEVKFAILK